jgi:SAM-dependent methyltransferase
MEPPRLTDSNALARNRARARRMPADFLQNAMADEVQERLIDVNRPFTSALIITGTPDLWRARMPDAHIIADTDVLDAEQGTYDLVIHALSLHWAQDLVGQLVQSRRALKPDGLFIATLFGGDTLNELRTALAEAEVAVTGGLSPRVAPMAEIRDLGGLLQRAGLALPVADATPFNVTYTDIYALMRDLRAMGEGNALAARLRKPTRRAVFKQAAAIYDQHFGLSDGRIAATFDVVTLTGWAPAESQPQPLRPGSAKTRLADALGTLEAPLPRQGD